jgi:murein DD-endopeptidase MepM/ murein hydrolase activator NlpD
MADGSKFSNFTKRIREKHKLSFTDDDSYHERWSFNLSSLNLLSLLLLYSIILLFIIVLLFKFTPLGNILTTSDTGASNTQIDQNTATIDSLAEMTESRQKYLDDLRKILGNESFDDSLGSQPNDSLFRNYQANFNKSKEDSLLRYKVENQDVPDKSIQYDFFFAPVKGTISKSFNGADGHYGVDVVTTKSEAIKSCLEGTIIFASWTPNDGDIIIIQHKNDYISVYKHCSSLLKKFGDQVQTV